MNALGILESAFRLIQVLSPGETLESGDAEAGLEVLNDMLDQWSIERLMVFSVARNIFNLNSGQQTYLYGQGAPDFNSPRPPRIDRMGIINIYSNPAQPLEIPIEYLDDVQRWAQIPVKATQSALPTTCYDNCDFPYRQLNFYPVPNVSGVQAVIYAWQALSQFADLDTEYTFPPGYRKAIRYSLAVDLAAEWTGKEPAAVIVQTAIAAKAKLAPVNTPETVMNCDPAIGTSGKQIFNWLTGESR